MRNQRKFKWWFEGVDRKGKGFVDIHDYAGGLKYGLGWKARAYGIASMMGLLFVRCPPASPLPHRTLLPSAATIKHHNDVRRMTGGEAHAPLAAAGAANLRARAEAVASAPPFLSKK